MKKNISHEDFLRAVKGQKVSKARFFQIESKRHQIRTVEKTKSSIVFFNDKRYFVSPNISLSYGHKNIK